jgi:hypothetical protein
MPATPAMIAPMRPNHRARVRLIHWNRAEGEARASQLRDAGYDVHFGPFDVATLRGLRDDPPDAVVIDLTRIPSHGRDVGLTVRQYKQTRHVPLVFVEGDPEKVAKIRALLPDATYASWRGIRGALARALRPAKASGPPVVPASRLAGYSGTPLAKKLGIKPGATVTLVTPPEDVASILSGLPEGVTLTRRHGKSVDLILWFVRSRRELAARIAAMVPKVGPGGIWICWPKKASALAGDLGQVEVRAIGLASGIVDYKVCAIDTTWSGLKFARRAGRSAPA